MMTLKEYPEDNRYLQLTKLRGQLIGAEAHIKNLKTQIQILEMMTEEEFQKARERIIQHNHEVLSTIPGISKEQLLTQIGDLLP